MVEIREVKTKRELNDFIDFPEKLYHDNPYFVPPFRGEEMDTLRDDKNPAFEFCEAKYYLAYKDGKLVGRIGAILNHRYNDAKNEKRMRFTRPDFIDDFEVSGALMDAVEAFAKEKGMERVHGPVGFCDLDKQGMLIEGFEELNMSITVYNAPYYKTHMERLGYAKEADWVEFDLIAPKEIDVRLDKIAQGVARRTGVRRVMFKSAKDVHPYIMPVFHLLNEAYAHLYGFVALTPALRDFYVKQFFGFLQPDYTILLLDQEDNVAGFAIAFPSLAMAMKKARGRLFPFGFIHLLKALKTSKELEFALIAVRHDLQGLGVNAVLMNETLRAAVKNGIVRAETGPELELNEKVSSQWKIFKDVRQHKRRRSWYKDI